MCTCLSSTSTTTIPVQIQTFLLDLEKRNLKSVHTIQIQTNMDFMKLVSRSCSVLDKKIVNVVITEVLLMLL